tara:strand:- start:9113 stop:10237 length:1125 start_codon:yes stop_codon:yes gene_type:complete
MIVIVSHITDLNGPTENLINYLKYKQKKFLSLSLPFSYSNKPISIETLDSKKSFNLNFKNPFINILKDSIMILFLFFKYYRIRKIEYFIGINPMNFYLYFILSKIFLIKIDHKVLYTIDWIKDRFNNKYFNKFYHYIDSRAVIYCDVNWIVSQKIISVRKAQFRNINLKKFYHLPIGIRVNKNKLNNQITKNICYVGAFHKEKGIELLLDILSHYKFENKYDLKFHFIGKTPTTNKKSISYEKIFKDRFNSLVITKYFDNLIELDNYLYSMDIGFAFFNPNIKSISEFSDPSKIKDYISNGVVTLMNDFNPISQDIKKYSLGIIMEYDKSKIISEIDNLYSNQDKILNMKKNINTYKDSISWTNLFDEALDYDV